MKKFFSKINKKAVVFFAAGSLILFLSYLAMTEAEFKKMLITASILTIYIFFRITTKKQ